MLIEYNNKEQINLFNSPYNNIKCTRDITWYCSIFEMSVAKTNRNS